MKTKFLFLFFTFIFFCISAFAQNFKFDTVKVIDTMFLPDYFHIDEDCNIYTANITSGLAKLYKLDSNLNMVWEASLHPYNHSVIKVRDITTDGKKNVYWLVSLQNGCVTLPDTTYCYSFKDILIIKYDSLGNYIWSKEMKGNTTNFAWAIDCDNNNNIFISGYCYGSNYFYINDSTRIEDVNGKSFIFKFAPNGNIIRYIFFGTNWTVSARIYFRNEKIYIPFGFSGTFNLDTNIIAPNQHFYSGILVLDSTFNYINSKIIKGNTLSPFCIAFDEYDNIYFTGRFKDSLYLATDTFVSLNSNSTFLLKLNKNLDIKYNQIFYNNNCNSIFLGKIEYENKELFLSMSNSIGDTIFWGNEIYPMNGASEYIFVLDSNFNKKQIILNHGQYFDIYDFKVIKRNKKIFIYDLGVFGPDTYFNNQLAIDSSYKGGVFISVFSKNIPEPKIPEENPYLKIYPNPTQDVLFIDFLNYNINFVQINIYNLLGQQIKTENHNVISDENKFQIDFSGLQTGTYIILIKTNKFIISKKVIKL